ncbi:type I glyceraldehyde-3-phosphate dehydrogenase [Spiroplasma turonicum]|uniref:Glyceraldehyde-3-phosphate dehydrogenase n=1 Tax=Spiroplasma turonicum TaxID=216946 RepID=A0A0K1P5G0_9MOLU|nr:type I glyceraldehyde-3-phosphate dehydrogenase [Spiroplasma turonicum]AKU79414.1 glyceraldehyde-3-phosphate dehydrogenase [Spiroplasma turonicum]ALX70435.1 glyceraldehyde-3-phosphate dehydrogenase [Spiroplasma turonicum]
MKKIAINGFGRIGRLAFRQLFEIKDIEIVAINDLTSADTLAYLLEFDSAHGQFMSDKISSKDGAIIVDGREIKILAEKDASQLPWKSLGIDLVIECTGFYVSKEKSQAHIDAGAKKVIISAPATGDLKTIVFGVNHKEITPSDLIVSAASCTTNCLSPVAKILDEKFGVVRGLMNTIHAVTNDQRLLDLPHSDLRRGRAAAWNIVPSKTGAAAAVGKVLPNLNGKLDGLALRVPVITGSIVDLTVELEKEVTVESLNSAIESAIKADADLALALQYCTKQIVSQDVVSSKYGSIFDATLTKVMTVDGKQLVKVFAWYDNESSFTSQFIRTIKHMLTV